jgi:hypothetical protein
LRQALEELIPHAEHSARPFRRGSSILPTDIPTLSDDECLARLARAVETPDSASLDEVAVLIGRLAVAIE